MENKLSNQSICRLNISDNTTEILKRAKIDTIGKLCRKNESSLKQLKLPEDEIEKIDYTLQLLGLKLKNSL